MKGASVGVFDGGLLGDWFHPLPFPIVFHSPSSHVVPCPGTPRGSRRPQRSDTSMKAADGG